MLRKEGYQTKFVYSDEIYNRLIDKNSLLESINKEFNFSFINEEVKDVYCEDNGRPSIPPIILYKATLIQRLKGLSDEEMERVAKYDIEIKHFLGIPIEDTSFDYSTISVFRKRLGAKRFEIIFQKKLEHYSKARPLFKLDDEEKKKAFGKSVNRAVKLIEEIKDVNNPQSEIGG